jgi:hypothetical protein
VLKMINLLLLLVLIGACATSKDDPPEQVPEPIGPPLWSFEGGRPPCNGDYNLYRQGRQIQVQCFEWGGTFVYDNRGTLTPEAATMLDAQIAAANLDDTEPVNWMGSCGAFDSYGTETLWVGGQSISFETSCLIHGIVPLYEIVHTIDTEMSTCNPLDFVLLESVEPGCQVVF